MSHLCRHTGTSEAIRPSPFRPTLPVPTPPTTGTTTAQTADDGARFRDPDFYDASAIETQRGLALVRGIQGNVWQAAEKRLCVFQHLPGVDPASSETRPRSTWQGC